MHDVGMNMSQLAMSVKQIDDTIELAHEWSHQLLHATENFDMERIGAKLEAAMAALHEAHGALEDYEEAIEADHNSVGSVKLVYRGRTRARLRVRARASARGGR